MPKSTPTCNSIVNLMYRATAWANVADNAASSPLANTHVALHTADLTAATNSQAENETAYTNYARQAVARSTGWAAASGGATQNAATISFPQCGASGATLTHVSTGTTVSGATPVWHYGALNSPLAVSSGITPQFAAGALTVTES
jgi:predicted extracellular nuclease